MSVDIKEIKAGIGLGELKFGMSRDQVQHLLGEPEDKDSFIYEEEGNAEAESWYYDSLDISLEFDAEEDWKLVTIEINSTTHTLNNIAVIGLSKEALKNKLSDLNIQDWEHEELPLDEAPTHELLSSDQLAINFWFDEDAVTEVQWGPIFTDEDNIIWPA
ncbi:MAG: hypothetical protein JKY48_17340 [Flavobacteriales bacterium]|nr:hypothetical protein [Flavobacteriales bacterium]